MKELNFEVRQDLSDESLKDISCLCIVQHHEQTKNRINEIYEKSLVPFIYDSQNKIQKILSSKTILDCLGS